MDSQFRNLAFSEPEGNPVSGGGRVRVADLPADFTPDQGSHFCDTSITAHWFLLRQMGFSPRQIVAQLDFKFF